MGAATKHSGTRAGPTTSASHRLLYAPLALLLVLAGWHADPRAWGVHQFAFLPRPAWALATAALLLLLAPGVAARIGAAAAGRAGALCNSLPGLVATAVFSGALFYLGRIDFPFLGDGIAWVNALRDRQPFHNFEPLAVALTRVVAYGASPNHPENTVRLFSVLLGPPYVLATAALARTLWPNVYSRGLGWFLLIAHPMLLLYFGYVESYPLLVLLQILFALGLVLAARSRLPVAVPTAILGLALAAHLSAGAWIPALVALVVTRSAHGRVRRAAAALLAVLQALAIAALAVLATGDSPLRAVRAVAGEAALGGQSARWFFSLHHLVDLANEAGLILGPGLVLLGWAGARGVPVRPLLSRSEWLPLAWLLPGPLLVACIVQPRIGGARDWDLFLPVVLPALLLAVELWHTTAPADADRARDARPTLGVAAIPAGRAAGFACIATAGWLAVGLGAERSARRLELLQEPAGTFSSFARGYANETLAIYYRDRDMTAARDAWLRATQANPKNPRYFNNLGMDELRLGRTESACAAFHRALELGMEEYFVVFNVGTCERTAGNLETAEHYFDRLVAQSPERWEAWSARGLVRVLLHRPQEALADLQRAGAVAPHDAETQYRLGLALRDLGRPDEARSAWERALRISPAHRGARARLQELGPAAAEK